MWGRKVILTVQSSGKNHKLWLRKDGRDIGCALLKLSYLVFIFLKCLQKIVEIINADGQMGIWTSALPNSSWAYYPKQPKIVTIIE